MLQGQMSEEPGNSGQPLVTLQAPPEQSRPASHHVIVRGADGLAYRRTVQVFIVNELGQFLVCCPVGPTNKHYRQTVQGGSEAGEAPVATAIRETWEEIGLDLTRAGFLVSEVTSATAAAAAASQGASPPGYSVNPTATSGEGEARNKKGELCSDVRAAFRYLSKKWRKEGIVGQELYPVLYFVPSACIRFVDVRSRGRGVRQEFRAAYWGRLEELERCAPPVKSSVMANVCPLVAATVIPFLRGRSISLDALAPYTSSGALS